MSKDTKKAAGIPTVLPNNNPSNAAPLLPMVRPASAAATTGNNDRRGAPRVASAATASKQGLSRRQRIQAKQQQQQQPNATQKKQQTSVPQISSATPAAGNAPTKHQTDVLKTPQPPKIASKPANASAPAKQPPSVSAPSNSNYTPAKNAAAPVQTSNIQIMRNPAGANAVKTPIATPKKPNQAEKRFVKNNNQKNVSKRSNNYVAANDKLAADVDNLLISCDHMTTGNLIRVLIDQMQRPEDKTLSMLDAVRHDLMHVLDARFAAAYGRGACQSHPFGSTISTLSFQGKEIHCACKAQCV